MGSELGEAPAGFDFGLAPTPVTQKAKAKSAKQGPEPAPQETGLPGLVPAAPPSRITRNGHRQRMRERLMTAGPDSVADHELLEMILHIAQPRRDTKTIAYALINQFGTFARAVTAPPPELRMIPNLGDAGIAALKTVQAAALRFMKAEVMEAPVLNNWERLLAYLTAATSREKIEQFRILFLDSKNRLLADEEQSRGTVNHTPVYPREVVKRALELHATAIILVHNHPSGDPTPSKDDLAMTAQIKQAAAVLSVALHDHVIVGNGRIFSFRAEGCL